MTAGADRAGTLDRPALEGGGGGTLAALGIAEGQAGQILIAGQPRPGAARPPRSALEVHHPKELVLALARAALEASGVGVTETNPHFLPIVEWRKEATVLHGAPLDLVCPVPVVRNAMVLDGEDLLALAEERMGGDPEGLRHRRLALMDRILALVPEAAWTGLPVQGLAVEPAPMASLLAGAGTLRAATGDGARPRPVRWLPCDFESGPYNFLALRRDRQPGSSQVAVQMEAAARGGGPVLLAFATPGTIGEFGPLLRAFRAFEQEGGRASLFVFFFGTPEELAAALAARPQALFFGDNFRSARVRFLFAPFAAGELLAAVARAGGVVDSAYGGVLEALAAGLGVAHRLVLGPGGRFDRFGAMGPHGIDRAALFAPPTLIRRRQAADRSGERALVDAIGALGAG